MQSYYDPSANEEALATATTRHGSSAADKAVPSVQFSSGQGHTQEFPEEAGIYVISKESHHLHQQQLDHEPEAKVKVAAAHKVPKRLIFQLEDHQRDSGDLQPKVSIHPSLDKSSVPSISISLSQLSTQPDCSSTHVINYLPRTLKHNYTRDH